jgi:methylmalonyl-CoA mutase cobalamin-binding domain/chain
MTNKQSRSQVPLKQFYSPEDVQDLDYAKRLNSPGLYPFTRGRRADLYGKTGWIQRGLSGEGDPVKSNKQIKYLISKGQVGIDVIGDSPTMAMLDPDHPLAANAIGTQGVSLCCLDDYKKLYSGIQLDTISVSASLPAIFALTGLYLTAKEQGISPQVLRGSVLQAPFYAEDCGYAMHMPFDLRLRLSLDSMEFCAREMPKFHSFVEDTYFFSESGLNAVEEMALGFIEIRHLVREMLKRGVEIDSFAPRIAILVNCGMDFFEEIAKIRAARRLFARMMENEFGARDPRSMAVVITSHTSGLSLTAQQPANNIVRGAIQSLGLVLAGVQAIEISGFDEAYRTPTKESHLVGLRTQQVIQLETGAAKVDDPLGGSYFLESLTNEIEDRIWGMIQEIEAKGDPAELSDKGWFRQLFLEAMERYSDQIADGRWVKVGANIHEIPDSEDTLLKDIAEKKFEPCWDRIEEIEMYRKSRNQEKVKAVLHKVHESALQQDAGLIEPAFEAFAVGATLGEVAGVMRLAYDYPYDPHGWLEPPI